MKTNKKSRQPKEKIARYETGGIRSSKEGKINYIGILPPVVLRAFGKYMHKMAKLPNGSYRAVDNWQKGMPVQRYLESLGRHHEAVQFLCKATEGTNKDLHEALMGTLFNTVALTFELAVWTGETNRDQEPYFFNEADKKVQYAYAAWDKEQAKKR